MLNYEDAQAVMASAEVVCSAEELQRALRRLAQEIAQRLEREHPLVLCVMNGGLVVGGQLLPQLNFPLELDTIQTTRYGAAILGGQLEWRVAPRDNVVGRSVLVLDDILDEGKTLAEVRERLVKMGAKEVLIAVLADKVIGQPKPVQPDFVGVRLPNRYVFGFGLDVKGAWRNLPAIYALRE